MTYGKPARTRPSGLQGFLGRGENLSRAPRSLAALAIVSLISAGCAGTGTASGGGNNAATHHAQAVRFAKCMRSNGVSTFPDPNASGTLTLDGVLNGSSLNPSTPAWKRAIGACKDLEPPGFAGHKRSAQEQQAAVRFAQCIRASGVPDFPDPTPNGPLVDTNRIPSAATNSGIGILNAAMQKCRVLAAALGVHR